ncbi:hypothetical protein K1B30_003654 [Vibrio parahaemolyticus]|nr:hypothetical protein [Vibrio parahaemolyticus]EIU6803079.1 hypothetical protein [Vibrio parahaemolyticus]
MPSKPSPLFKPNHEYKLTFRNGQTNKLSKACSITDTTPKEFIKKSVLTAAKASIIASENGK